MVAAPRCCYPLHFSARPQSSHPMNVTGTVCSVYAGCPARRLRRPTAKNAVPELTNPFSGYAFTRNRPAYFRIKSPSSKHAISIKIHASDDAHCSLFYSALFAYENCTETSKPFIILSINLDSEVSGLDVRRNLTIEIIHNL